MFPLVEAELAFGTVFSSLVAAEVFRRRRDFVGHSCHPFGDSETFFATYPFCPPRRCCKFSVHLQSLFSPAFDLAACKRDLGSGLE
jgi:hypothetical protein